MTKTTKPLLAAAAMTLLLVAVPAAADAKTYIGGPIVSGAVENGLDWLINTFGNESAAREVKEKEG